MFGHKLFISLKNGARNLNNTFLAKSAANEKRKYIILKNIETQFVIHIYGSSIFLAIESPTSSPGGNQVDGLPPASSVKNDAR